MVVIYEHNSNSQIIFYIYQDDTHYFVMTTKKHSLLDRKVLKKDLNDPIALLSPKNVNKENLLEYIRDACDYCTDYQVKAKATFTFTIR